MSTTRRDKIGLITTGPVALVHDAKGNSKFDAVQKLNNELPVLTGLYDEVVVSTWACREAKELDDRAPNVTVLEGSLPDKFPRDNSLSNPSRNMYLQSQLIVNGLEAIREFGITYVARTRVDDTLGSYERLAMQTRTFSDRQRFLVAAYRPGWHYFSHDAIFVGNVDELLKVFKHHLDRPQRYWNIHLDLFSVYQETSELSKSKWSHLPIRESLLERRRICECQMRATMETWAGIGVIDRKAIWPLKIRGAVSARQSYDCYFSPGGSFVPKPTFEGRSCTLIHHILSVDWLLWLLNSGRLGNQTKSVLSVIRDRLDKIRRSTFRKNNKKFMGILWKLNTLLPFKRCARPTQDTVAARL